MLQLDHRLSTSDNGVTRRYIGPLRQSTYGERLKLADNDLFGLQANPVDVFPARKRTRQIASIEVDHVLEDNELQQRLHGLGKPRVAALKIAKKRCLASARLNHEESMNETQSSPTSVTSIPSSGQIDLSIAESEPSNHREEAGGTADDPITILDDPIAVPDAATPTPSEPHRILNILKCEGDAEDSESFMDTEPCAVDSITKEISDPTVGESEVSKISGTSAYAFIEHFSRRNDHAIAIGYNSPSTYADTEMLCGGSRDPPTLKHFTCKYADRGCDLKNTSLYLLHKHEMRCPLKEGPHIYRRSCDGCSIVDCEFVATSSSRQGLSDKMSRHRRLQTYTPQKCDQAVFSSCDRVFQTPGTLEQHVRAYHAKEWDPTPAR